MRKICLFLHTWFGLLAGLGLLLLGLTGSVLVFNDELSAILTPRAIVVTPTPAGRLPVDTLLRHAERQLPDCDITGWQIQPEGSRLADHLYLIRRGGTEWQAATLDPYTGRVLSSPHSYDATVLGWLLAFHTDFQAGDIGLFLAGLFALLLCLLGLTGLWLYHDFWASLVTFRWRRGARILFTDLHRFLGITSVAFNLVLGFTGAYWNLTEVWDHASGHEARQTPITHRLYSPRLSLAAAIRDASNRLPGYETRFISLPSNPAAPSVILWGAVEPRPLLASRFGTLVLYDPVTGAHRGTSDLRQATWWHRVRDTFKPLHYGDFGGIFVKILWCLGGLTPGVLAVSGFAIWWLRRPKQPRPPRPSSSFPS
jgi:uncharacterized iron-regulated membrane protein